MPVATIPLTIRLPQPEVAFLENYANRHHFTIAELIDLYIKQLQLAEQVSATFVRNAEIETEIAQHRGLLPSDIDGRKEYYDYVEKKHQ